MLIDISDIVFGGKEEMTTAVPLGLSVFSSRLGTFPVTGKSPVDLRIANLKNRKLKVCGSADLVVTVPCSRCLDEVPVELSLVIDRTLRLEGSAGGGNAGITEDDGSAGDDAAEAPDYLDGWKLDTDRLVFGELLVNWPVKVLCREDCRGICRVCGANLNQGDCGCQRAVPDPRMAAIQDVFNKFKEV